MLCQLEQRLRSEGTHYPCGRKPQSLQVSQCQGPVINATYRVVERCSYTENVAGNKVLESRQASKKTTLGLPYRTAFSAI